MRSWDCNVKDLGARRDEEYSFNLLPDNVVFQQPCRPFNPLPDNRSLDWSKLKQITDDILKRI